MASSSKRFAEAEAVLEAKRSALTAEKERAYIYDQALKAVMALISQKDGELEVA